MSVKSEPTPNPRRRKPAAKPASLPTASDISVRAFAVLSADGVFGVQSFGDKELIDELNDAVRRVCVAAGLSGPCSWALSDRKLSDGRYWIYLSINGVVRRSVLTRQPRVAVIQMVSDFIRRVAVDIGVPSE